MSSNAPRTVVKEYRMLHRHGEWRVQKYKSLENRPPYSGYGVYECIKKVPSTVQNKMALLDIALGSRTTYQGGWIYVAGVGATRRTRSWRGNEPSRYYQVIIKEGDYD